MAMTVAAAAICVVIFKITGKKIRHVLEQEYGELKGNKNGRRN